MKTRMIFAALAGLTLSIGLNAGAVSAATATGACTTGGYTANNMITYTTSGTNWLIEYVSYMFSPSNSLSTHNNVNEAMYSSSGSLLFAWNSPDTLIRTGSWYVANYFATPLVFSSGSRMVFTNIIDVPNAADPQCTVTVQR